MRNAAALLLTAWFWPALALAGVAGTAHDTGLGGTDGACSTCHLPHQAAGEKFWAVDPVYEGKVGTVSALCGSCHHSGEGYGALMTRAHSDDNVYAPNSHGQKMFLASPPPGTDLVRSGLPAVDTVHGNFECTTCHSVHDDTYRPFLRDAPTRLCARCHAQRHFVAGVDHSGPVAEPGAWGVPARSGTKNPGSHPVGEDITGTRPDGPSVSIPEAFRTPLSPEPGKWSLGGHLTRGREGGVTCITCHSVHGVAPDPDDPGVAGPSTPPGADFLTVSQAVASVPDYPRKLANGGGGKSALCEACHGVGNNPAKAPGGAAWADSRSNVSPGKKGKYSHPIDSYPSSVDTGVSRFPDGWPAGGGFLPGRNVFPILICETCHAPHPAAALSVGRKDVRPGAGGYLLRAPLAGADSTGLCGNCHAAPVAGHHPVNKAFDSTGVTYLSSVVGGAGDTLTCATCHTGVHDWTEPSWASLDPSWKPHDNGRNPQQAIDMYNRDMSKTCMDCHYFMDGDGASVSPTLGARQTVIQPTDAEYVHYQAADKSSATHYIGLIHEGGPWQHNPLVDIFSTTKTWYDQKPGAPYAPALANGWARFGGENRDGARVLVCESCHELEPGKNRHTRHLLLAPYEEGRNGLEEYPGDIDGRDVHCEACHGVPVGTHPMTGSVVSRTGAPLNSGAEWIRKQILGYATMSREKNSLSCDSCHQPHDANANSFTFVLDAPAVGPIGAYEIPIAPGIIDPLKPAELASMGYTEAGTGNKGTYATPTLEGRGGPYHGQCVQCHEM